MDGRLIAAQHGSQAAVPAIHLTVIPGA